jgi:tetratricopeptide (TPR) repeat protein
VCGTKVNCCNVTGRRNFFSADYRGEAQATQSSAAASPHNAEATGDVGKYSNWDQLAAHQHGSLSFQGKVTLPDGQLPWDPIPVVVNCGGTPRYNTQTDAKGGFRIEAAPRESEISPGKPNSKLPGPAQLIGCDVRATLTGYQSTILTIANRSIVDDSDIGTITLKRDERTPGTSASVTTGTAPRDALKFFDKARADANNHHPESAQHELEKAVHAYPQFAEAWYQLGKLEEAQKPPDAWDAYSKAIAADPQFTPPYVHLAAIAALQKKWQEVVDATEHALQLNPEGTPQLWYYSAVGNYNLGRKDAAETSANTSLAMDPSHVAPNTEQLLAVMLAGRGDYSGALNHLRSCLAYTAPGPNADMIKQQVAQLEKVVPQTEK